MERPVYTTKWLKYRLKKLNIEDNFLRLDIKDEYSNLFWMDYTDEFVEYTDTKNEFKDYPYLGWVRRHTLNVDIPKEYILSKDYPITWEANASQADYDKLSVLSNKYVNKKISPTHLLHAAEMFLYLLKIGDL